ncbi:MAG: UDP-2,4-diacetamido-2,4,6-trideoxy-beta-L-altropyranose hydrolase [Lachnospiraceae bacterium]|nr:UDP-2,4-diacetamido-2,4,6-trideoxy-beta-L-altropyranose hydrolase [Lachnospiraceae bacterium]
MLYIRADGNTQIGMGHIMRCLSIAEAAVALGAKYEPVFLVADEGCLSMIEERGFRVMVLHTDYKNMISELPQLNKLLDREQDILLVDSYQADTAYFEAVSELAFTVCLEDMGEPYPVDLLINYNLYAPKLREKYQLNGKPLNMLLGAEYMPLRSVFQKDTEYHVKDKVTDVMITTGGSDPYFAAGAFAEAFLSAECELCGGDDKNQITWHIVSGPFNAFADRLKETYGEYENVVIYEGLKDLKALMKRCDVVLTATGSTVYEVSALGVPMIAFYFAENQRQGAEELAELTDIVNVGCFSDDRDRVIGKAVEALKKCVNDKKYRMLLYQQERRLIDGKGAERIASEIFRLQEEQDSRAL